MTPKKERQTAYSLAFILLLVGVFCYAGIPEETPDEPVRLVFKGTAGKVVFDHAIHVSDSGYGLSCVDCHHHPEDEELESRACRECHLSTNVKSSNFSPLCMECHDADEDEIQETEMLNKKDVMHSQCFGCHEEYESGPVEKDCYSCHVL